MAEPVAVPCGNYVIHRESDPPPPAVAYLSWPDGRHRPTTACRVCFADILHEVAEEAIPGHPDFSPLLIEPVTGERRYEGRRIGVTGDG